MSSIPSRSRFTPKTRNVDLTALIPDFPFDYGGFLEAARGRPSLFQPPQDPVYRAKRILVVGAGATGAVAAYELLRMGFRPVLVEASDRYGGRLDSHRLGDGNQQVIAELGAMRFPMSGKAGKHYFEKLGMWQNSVEFPNPGSAEAVSTVVDYRGEQVYYEYESDEYPIPAEYEQLEEDMFDEQGFLNRYARLYDMQSWMTGDIDNDKQKNIKDVWNELLNGDGQLNEKWDDLSFYGALTKISGWSPEQINLFGQIGFGTGGWNTDFPNSILEVMRVLYTGLDVDHRLMFDGTSALPNKLITLTPAQLGDSSDGSTANLSVERTSIEFLQAHFPEGASALGKEVRHIARNQSNTLMATIRDTASSEEKKLEFDAVIYTPHVRILDKFRHYGTEEDYRATTQLLSADLWEAIEYTHYMQSAKIFMATKEPFWKERLPPAGEETLGKFPMSVTLSDRLTRGTYLIDYGENPSPGGVKGSGIFLSYTWNDDSLKFLGDRNASGALLTHAHMCRTVLQDIYPNLRLVDYLAPGSNVEVEINWEDEPLYLGAFKMNLPGQYEYQRRLFSQFMAGFEGNGVPDPFVLAGDDTSWTAGWVEGAISSAINAVNKIAWMFSGTDWPGVRSPMSAWPRLRPIELSAPEMPARTTQRAAATKEPSEII